MCADILNKMKCDGYSSNRSESVEVHMWQLAVCVVCSCVREAAFVTSRITRLTNFERREAKVRLEPRVAILGSCITCRNSTRSKDIVLACPKQLHSLAV
jgi:hypothetical protein